MTNPRPGLYEALLKRRAEQAAELPSKSGAGSVVRFPRGFVYVIVFLWGGTLIFAWGLGRGTGRTQGFEEAVLAIQTESIPQLPPPPSLEADGLRFLSEDPRGPAGAASDPRQPGLNYLVVQSGSNQKALSELLEHLRSEGLAAFMTSATISSSRVLLSEGFSAPKSDPRAVALLDRLHRAGMAWKTSGGGSDLTDAYWEKFNGS